MSCHVSLLQRFFRMPLNYWWARQRAIDLEILWPICKENARDLDHAKAAFAMHAFDDLRAGSNITDTTNLLKWLEN